jgi:hypothetical protein
MNILKITLTLIGMHLLGSAILFAYVSGPNAIFASPVLCLFGWFFLIPEIIGLALIWKFYEPYRNQDWKRTAKFTLVFCIIGAFMAAPFVPKEENNEIEYWIAGLLAGFCAAGFCFACIHVIKLSNRYRTEPDISAEAKGHGTSAKAP